MHSFVKESERNNKMGIHITVPWKNRLKGKHWWVPKKHRAEPVNPVFLKEDDFDHLGTLHKAARHIDKC